MGLEQVANPRLVVDHAGDRGQLYRQRRRAKDPAEDPQAQAGGVGEQRRQVAADQLGVSRMLGLVQWEAVTGDAAQRLDRLDDLDDVFDVDVVAFGRDHDPAEGDVDLGPIDALDLGDGVLHRVGDLGRPGMEKASHLDMCPAAGGPRAAADPSGRGQRVTDAG